jgi:hypothetical protein
MPERDGGGVIAPTNALSPWRDRAPRARSMTRHRRRPGLLGLTDADAHGDHHILAFDSEDAGLGPADEDLKSSGATPAYFMATFHIA